MVAVRAFFPMVVAMVVIVIVIVAMVRVAMPTGRVVGGVAGGRIGVIVVATHARTIRTGWRGDYYITATASLIRKKFPWVPHDKATRGRANAHR